MMPRVPMPRWLAAPIVWLTNLLVLPLGPGAARRMDNGSWRTVAAVMAFYLALFALLFWLVIGPQRLQYESELLFWVIGRWIAPLFKH